MKVGLSIKLILGIILAFSIVFVGMWLYPHLWYRYMEWRLHSSEETIRAAAAKKIADKSDPALVRVSKWLKSRRDPDVLGALLVIRELDKPTRKEFYPDVDKILDRPASEITLAAASIMDNSSDNWENRYKGMPLRLANMYAYTLRNGPEYSRRNAIRELANLPVTSAREALIYAAGNDEDCDNRRRALDYLENFKGPAAVTALLYALKNDSSDSVRYMAAHEIRWQSRRDKRIMPALVEALEKDQDASVRSCAASSLACFGYKAAAPALEKALAGDVAPGVQASAVKALASLGVTRAFDSLADALENNASSQVCIAAAQSLVSLDAEKAWKHLVNTLEKDPDETVRRNVIEAVSGHYPRAKATELFCRVLARDDDGSVRAEAAKTLGEINAWSTVTTCPAVEPLLHALIEESNESVRSNAACALGKIREKSAVPTLIAVLENKPLEEIRMTAASVQADCVNTNGKTSRFKELIRSSNRDVRRVAAVALGKLRDPRAKGPLIAALLHARDNDIRSNCLGALDEFNNTDLFDVFVQALGGDPYYRNRIKAARVLARRYPGRSVMVLMHARKNDPDSCVTSTISDIFDCMKSGRAAGGLLKVLEFEHDAQYRAIAAKVLGKICDNGAEAGLLKSLADDPNAWVRRTCAESLGAIGRNSSVTALVRALENDSDFNVRSEAAESLGMIEDSRAAEPLIAALEKNPNSGVRCCAADSLAAVGDVRAVPALCRAALKDRSRGVRLAAINALGLLDDKRALKPLLVALSKDSYGNARSAAACSLGMLGDMDAVGPLIQALENDKQGCVRRDAANALGCLGDERAVDALFKTLAKDKDGDVRGYSGAALGSIGAKKTVGGLINLLDTNPRWDVRASAVRALGHVKSRRAVARLIRVFQKKDDRAFKVDALDALAMQGNPLAEDAVIKILENKDESGDVRMAAARALGSVGTFRSHAVFARLLKDKDESKDIRDGCIFALIKMPCEKKIKLIRKLADKGLDVAKLAITWMTGEDLDVIKGRSLYGRDYYFRAAINARWGDLSGFNILIRELTSPYYYNLIPFYEEVFKRMPDGFPRYKWHDKSREREIQQRNIRKWYKKNRKAVKWDAETRKYKIANK